MEMRFTDYSSNPRLLEGRSEPCYQMIYPGDIVIASPRWAGKEKNPLENRLGYVTQVFHGEQSHFNREYFCVDLIGADEKGKEKLRSMWLYTLDIFERKQDSIFCRIKEKFGIPIYIDDRIRMRQGEHEGRFGGILGIVADEDNKKLYLEIFDDEKKEEINRTEWELIRMTDEIFQEKISESAIIEDLAKKFQIGESYLIEYLKKKKDLIDEYKKTIHRKIYDSERSKPGFSRKIEKLHEDARFTVSSNNIELLERFPPNNLFKI